MNLWRLLLISSFVAMSPGWAQENKRLHVIDGLTFDSDFENGSLGEVRELMPNRIACALHTEQGELGERRYWFRFRMRGVENRQLTLILDHQENPRPFIRIGTEPWRRMTEIEAPTLDRLELSFGPSETEVELAFFEPLGLTETEAELEELIKNIGVLVQRDLLGMSEEGRALELITVTNPLVSDTGKHRVWVHSRAHAGEVTSTHVMLGLLEQCLADSSVGRVLRDELILQVLPVLNVDGVARGYTRWDASGRDPESQWCAIASPAVRAVKDRVDSLMASPQPIELALNLHSTRGVYRDTFFFKHLAPSVSEEFEAIQQRYIGALDRATPLFDNLSPETSQLHTCRFIESYFWNGWGEQVTALTHEGHFHRRLPDGKWLTGEDYRELGRAMARSMIDYFDLSLPPGNQRTYQLWQEQHFDRFEIALPGLSGPANDPDGDGLANLIEYAFGSSPRDKSSAPRSAQRQVGKLTFERQQDLADLEWRVETSSDLRHWELDSIVEAEVIPLALERERVILRLRNENTERAYARLVIALK